MGLLMNQCSAFPNKISGADIWENWHKSLVRCVGRPRANDLFLRLWQKRAGASSSASTIRLRAYMRTQGVELSLTGAKKVSDFFSEVDSFFAGMRSGMKILYFGLIGIVILAGVGFVYTLFVNPQKAVRIGTAVATKGKSEAAMMGAGKSSPKMINVKKSSPKMINVKAK